MSESPSTKPPITSWLGIAFLLVGLLLAYSLVAFWPRLKNDPPQQQSIVNPGGSAVSAPQEKKVWDEETHFLGVPFPLDADVRLLVLVLIAGALGSYIHAVQSFASYVGNASFKSTWTWWYILRLPMGAALALFIYFVVRGGLLAAGAATAAGANDLNLFGIMSFSGLAGLFSKQAADKLSEVFDTLFSTKEDRKREDKLGENPRPQVSSIVPASVNRSAGETEITVNGQGFVKDSVVKVSGKELRTTFVTPGILTAKLSPGSFEDRSEVEVSVVSPAPGGGESDPKPLSIKAGSGDGLATVTPISD
jgi:hypothetical protein